jgi:hypothetical protein
MIRESLALPNDADRPALECRVFERLACEIPAKCHPASLMDMKEAGWDGVIDDISQGGIRVSLQRRFERGTALAIALPGGSAEEPTVVFAKVVHLRRSDAGGWSLGCKFVSALSDDEVQRLLGQQQHVSSTPVEKPAAKPNAIKEGVLSNVSLEIEDTRGRVTVCTIRRLDASSSWPLGPGKSLRIQGVAKDQSRVSFEVELSHVTQDGQLWRLRGRRI